MLNPECQVPAISVSGKSGVETVIFTEFKTESCFNKRIQ